MKRKIISVIFLIFIYAIFFSNIKVLAVNSEESLDEEYISKSIIVETSNIEEIKNDDNIENIVEVADDLYIVDYINEKSAKEGFSNLENNDNIEKIFNDIEVSIFNNDENVSIASVNKSNIAWGVESTGMDHYTDYLNYKAKKDILVAVIDTGINLNHETFINKTNADRINTSYSHNYILNSNNISDDQGHGTMVASAISESAPSNVKIVPIKVLDKNGKGSLYNIIKAILDVKDKVDIVNLSLGVPMNELQEDEFEAYESILKEIYNNGNGPLIVCAAGNSGKQEVAYPASSSYTIAVSALNRTSTGKIEFASDFSNYGDKIDFSAPGKDILLANYKNNYGYVNASGTSVATPFVSSALALLKSDYPEMKSTELKEKLILYCDDLGQIGKDIYYGYGSINFIPKMFEKPVISNIEKNNINSNVCRIKANAVCDDIIEKYAYVLLGNSFSDANWINVSNTGTNVETTFDINKNGKYVVYFMDSEGETSYTTIIVEGLNEEPAKSALEVTSIKLDKTNLTLTKRKY